MTTDMMTDRTIDRTTDRKQISPDTGKRHPDCVTEIHRGNSVLVVSGFFKKDTTVTADDRMMKVLAAESAAGKEHESCA